jgi:hypothetical protein
MSIKTHLETAVKALEAEREREVAVIKDKATREKIVPFNRDLDIARDNAIAEKQTALNATILAHQEQFAKEKKEIIDAAEKKKVDNATAVITAEAYTVTVQYDKAIAKLKEQIEGLKE